jgi:Zn-dependent peptidase ImmA (M78 family)/DNA-binding XRE family transcriptional regulator
MIGERIRQARKMKALSLRDLAAKVGLSAQAISNYENGKDLPSSEVLLHLARALDRKVEFFLRPEVVGQITPAYRKKAKLSGSRLEQITAPIKEWLERYLQIEAILNEVEPHFQYPKGFPKTVGTLEEVERAAIDLRQAWNIGLDPIANLTELLEDKGIKVGEMQCLEGFDGCTFDAKADGKIPVIVCTDHMPGDRQRFTLAHELGHMMLKTGQDLEIEKAANRFAGAFLVPKPVAIEELGKQRKFLSPLELHLLKHKYGISMRAWIFRAQDVGVLPAQKAKSLLMLFNKRGWHKEEPGDQYPREHTRRMYRMIMHAFSQQVISETKAEELLGTSWNEFERRMSEEHGGIEVAVRNGQ